MKNNFEYETFIFISSSKLSIKVNSNLNKMIYEKNFMISENNHDLIFKKLDSFLMENIFEVEKKIQSFIKKTYVILDLEIFFPIRISIKKKNFENLVNISTLNYLLSEAKDCCKKTIETFKIAHMIIDNYQADEKDYDYFPNEINCKNFSIDITFICISDKLIKNLENVLSKYHISLSQVVNAHYIKNFLTSEKGDIYEMTQKIIRGHNPNEVMLTKKINKTKGFFEKFFNFFN